MRSWSLQRRLVVGVAAVVAVGLIVASAASVLLLRGYLLDRIDAQLLAASAPRGDDPRTGPPLPRSDDDRRDELPSQFVIALLDSTGAVVSSNTGTLVGASSAPVLSAFTAAEVSALGGRPTTVAAAGGGPGYRAVATSAPNGGSVVLASSLAPLEETTNRYLTLVAIVDLVVLLVLIVLAYFVVRVGLRPLDDVEATADQIAAGDFDRRVPEGSPGTEVGRLSLALNAMLEQISAAFAAREASENRLRRFIADASHELRTPLTSIRGYAELQRRGQVTEPADVAVAVARIESEAERMGRLVDDMLLLARLDQHRPLEQTDVDLGSLAREALDAARARTPDHGWSAQIPDAAVMVRGDHDRLRQVIDNLLSNAGTHTPAGTTVSVTVTSAPGPAGSVARLQVADDGPGMPQEVVDQVFERFFRADPSRSRAAGGSGLGLAIADAVTRSLGGGITCSSAVGAGTTFMVELPLLNL